MSRKDKAAVICVAILALTLALAISLSLLRRWQEAERARLEAREKAEEAQRQAAETREKLDRLKQWMGELGLPILVETEKPAADGEGDPPAPEEATPASDYSAAGQIIPNSYGKVVANQWFPRGIEPVMEVYLGWRETYPEGYARLIAWGRGESPPLAIDPAMQEAAKIAAAGQEIDDYLARWPRSPLAGHGLEFAHAGWEHGINPYLLIALAAAESTLATDGNYWMTNHNAWGMLGPNSFTIQAGIPVHNGACWWPDWPTAIDGAARFLAHFWPGAQTAYDLRGYCEGNPPSWISRVEAVRKELGGAPWTR